jgi:hypothetical protein
MPYFACGFNVIACIRASMNFDADLMRTVRPAYWDVSATNLLGFLVGSGFIASTLWMRCATKGPRRSACHALCAALGLTVLGLSFSTLFTRELERIWMFLTPLLLIGAACELDQLQPPYRTRWIVATMVLLFVQTWCSQLLLYTLW